MIFTKVPKPISGSLLLAAALLNACGSPAARSTLAAQVADVPAALTSAAGRTSFPVAIAPFPRLKYRTPSGGNSYGVALGPQTCAGSDSALQVETQDFYYNDLFTACLNLATGSLSAQAVSTAPPGGAAPRRHGFNETISMPLANAHYFDYVSRLEEMVFAVRIFGQVQAADALDQVLAEITSATDTDALALTNVQVGPDRHQVDLEFAVKLSAPRALIIRFGDQQQVYELKTQSLKATDRHVSVTVAKPEGLDYRDTAAVEAYLTPLGASAKDALMQVRLPLQLGTETLQFWPKDAAVTLHAGQSNPIVVRWHGLKERTVILRLLDQDGNLVREQRLDVAASAGSGAEPPAASRTELAFDLPVTVAAGDHYSLLGHLVPKGGQWQDEIASYEKKGIIRIRN